MAFHNCAMAYLLLFGTYASASMHPMFAPIMFTTLGMAVATSIGTLWRTASICDEADDMEYVTG